MFASLFVPAMVLFACLFGAVVFSGRRAMVPCRRPCPFIGRWTLLSYPLLFVGFGGCHAERTLNEEHTVDLEIAAEEALRVVDYLPAPNTPGVPTSMQPYFFFNREVNNPEELQLAVTNANGTNLVYNYAMDFDNVGITFVPGTLLYGAENSDEYLITLETPSDPPLVDDSNFLVTFPPGLIFNVSTDLKCLEFGGRGAQAKLLNSYFQPGVYPLWIMVAEDLDASTPLPAVKNLFLGPAYIRSSGAYRIYRHIGFSTTFSNVLIDGAGHFSATRDGAFFPLDTPNKVVLSYMVQMRIEGTFDLSVSPARINEMTISGVFPTRSLLLLSNESDAYATAINMVDLNVDLNGNGVPDSATFVASSFPEEIPVQNFDP